MASSDVSLIWNFKSQGMANIQRDIGAVAGSAAKAQVKFEKPPEVSGWKNAVGTVQGSMQGLLGTITKVAGAMGLAIGFGALKNEWSSMNDKLLEIQYQTGKTDTEMKLFSDNVTKQAESIGAYGSELANVIALLGDMGIIADEVLAKDVYLLAKMQGTTVQTVGAGLQATRTVLGPKATSVEALAAYSATAQAVPNIPEEVLTGILGKISGPLAGTGTRGAAGATAMLTTISQIFAGKPKEISTAIESLVSAIDDPKTKAELRKYGVDAPTIFRSLIEKARTVPSALDALPGPLRDTMLAVVKNEESLKIYDTALRGFAIDVSGMERTIAKAANRDPFKTILVQLQVALMPLMEGLAAWLTAHTGEIKSFFRTLVDFGPVLLIALASIKLAAIGFKVAGVGLSITGLAAGSGLMALLGPIGLGIGAFVALRYAVGNTSDAFTSLIDQMKEKRKLEHPEEFAAPWVENMPSVKARNKQVVAEYERQGGGGIMGLMEAIKNTINVNVQATITPDGITTKATATQDNRNASQPIVRTNYYSGQSMAY